MLDGVELHLVDSLDEANALKRWLGERRPILGLDTETGGLEWWREPLRMVQVGDATAGWAIPYEAGWPALVRELLNGYTGPIVGHNLPFDVTFLEQQADVHLLGTLHDTQTRARLLDPWRPAALKQLTAELIDQSAWVGQGILEAAMRQQQWTWRTVPLDFDWYWAYAALDAVLTAKLYEHQEPHLTATNAVAAYELEREVAEVLRRAEVRGLRVDLEYCTRKARELEDYADKVEEWCVAEYGVKPGSNFNVARKLREDGVSLTKRTKSGNVCLDEEVLSAIGHPLARQVLSRRKAQKMAGTYFEGMLRFADGDIVHTRIKPLGARTGRMSTESPSLQNLPRSKAVRDAFVCRDHHRLVLADYDQIELRLFTGYAHDAGLMAACTDVVDPMTSMARIAYRDDALAKGDQRRQIMKNAVYARLFGAGPDKFAATAGITLDEGQRVYDLMDARFPGMRVTQEQITRAAERRTPPYVATPSGRRLRVPEHKLYVAINYLIQGTAAEVLKRHLLDLDKAGLTEYFCLPVHDEVVLDVPEPYVDDVKAALPGVLEETIQDVPLTVGVAGGLERWGEKYD